MKPTILVVDDTPENIDVLKGALTPEYTIRPATSGPVALKIAALSPTPDLILLDVMMPGMDGYEVCRQLKENPSTRDIPIIFVTARSSETDELLGLHLGAVDYITKPFRIAVVRSRIATHMALRQATRQLAEQNRLLVEERHLIESILLKMRQPNLFQPQSIRSLVSPVERTAGDLLLSLFTPDQRQLVLLGDFTGHGLPAAIGGPLVDFILHDMALRNQSALQILHTINQQLCARLPTGIFLAATLIEISPKRHRAQLWNAGLPNLYLIRQGTLQHELASNMPPLGILNNLEMEPAMLSLDLQPGDRLYAFSDGVIEASSREGSLFGYERLRDFLCRTSLDNCPLELILEQLSLHTGNDSFADDITLVEIEL
ncbi:SpoIIE family protein phosphatase [Candidatus Magnetaquicoccus inordinatus]|uniref:SpoIIE family protein phosphatase n=1 Tax=Candidatus Magnetaquicoccus inordinatus TaxID=2496818 RepID=UPI00187D1A2B|nr:SpoIIE family protein phosphatase [Candidatus Magnetaquicoccus inordinatus]